MGIAMARSMGLPARLFSEIAPILPKWVLARQRDYCYIFHNTDTKKSFSPI
jgi:hypothetical protein